jgi:hypothetical protein
MLNLVIFGEFSLLYAKFHTSLFRGIFLTVPGTFLIWLTFQELLVLNKYRQQKMMRPPYNNMLNTVSYMYQAKFREIPKRFSSPLFFALVTAVH